MAFTAPSPYLEGMNKRPLTTGDLDAVLAKLRLTAQAALMERAKTDPEARKAVVDLRRKGVIPNA